MSGYKIGQAVLYSSSGKPLTSSERELLTCPYCQFILRDPYQAIECGHRYCYSCMEEILTTSSPRCVVDDAEISRSQVRKDKGCNKELVNLLVDCPGREFGCDWNGSLPDYEIHLDDCAMIAVHPHGGGKYLHRSEKVKHETRESEKRLKRCHRCNQEVQVEQMTEHLSKCELDYGSSCSECVPKMKFEEHKDYQCFDGTAQGSVPDCALKDSFMNKGFSHLARIITQLQEQLKERDVEIKELKKKMAALEIECENMKRKSAQRDSGFLSQSVSACARPDPSFGSHDTSHPIDAHSAIVSGTEQRISALERTVCKLQPVVMQVQHAVSRQGSQLAVCVEKVQAIQETATRHAVSMEELKLRQDALDVKTTTGVFVWKIPDIKKRYRDALDRRTVSLYSPPFYTSPHGYRICIRAYLNGDGSGMGTHISLLFVLMRSEQDNLLRWPFGYSVTFTLMDQGTHPSKSISKTFEPDPHNPSLQQPRSEMNIPGGFPRFAPVSVLNDESFTKGNALFIKCRVDTMGLQAD